MRSRILFTFKTPVANNPTAAAGNSVPTLAITNGSNIDKAQQTHASEILPTTTEGNSISSSNSVPVNLISQESASQNQTLQDRDDENSLCKAARVDNKNDLTDDSSLLEEVASKNSEAIANSTTNKLCVKKGELSVLDESSDKLQTCAKCGLVLSGITIECSSCMDHIHKKCTGLSIKVFNKVYEERSYLCKACLLLRQPILRDNSDRSNSLIDLATGKSDDDTPKPNIVSSNTLKTHSEVKTHNDALPPQLTPNTTPSNFPNTGKKFINEEKSTKKAQKQHEQNVSKLKIDTEKFAAQTALIPKLEDTIQSQKEQIRKLSLLAIVNDNQLSTDEVDKAADSCNNTKPHITSQTSYSASNQCANSHTLQDTVSSLQAQVHNLQAEMRFRDIVDQKIAINNLNMARLATPQCVFSHPYYAGTQHLPQPQLPHPQMMFYPQMPYTPYAATLPMQFTNMAQRNQYFIPSMQTHMYGAPPQYGYFPQNNHMFQSQTHMQNAHHFNNDKSRPQQNNTHVNAQNIAKENHTSTTVKVSVPKPSVPASSIPSSTNPAQDYPFPLGLERRAASP